MERQEDDTIELARITKTMARSNESLMRSISHFEDLNTRVVARPTGPQAHAISASIQMPVSSLTNIH